MSQEKHASDEQLRASHPWFLRIYRKFCEFIYGPGVGIYDIISQMISFGQWNHWRKLSLNFLPQGRVLELGYGTGWLQQELARSGRDVYGLEYSADMVSQCNKKLKNNHDCRRRVRGDGRILPFAEGVFNGIVATFPEQYIVSEECLRECRRVIKSNENFCLVLVGRWLELELPILKHIFPVFYRPLNLVEVEQFKICAQKCGWKMLLTPVKSGYVKHYIVVLTPT